MTTLAFKVNRRQLAAVVVSDGEVTFSECRYLRSNPERAQKATIGFVERLTLQLGPTAFVLYAPTVGESLTTTLCRAIEQWAVTRELPLARVTRDQLYGALGNPAARTARTLIEQLKELWPGVAGLGKPSLRPLSEAAAAALLGEVLYHLQSQSG